MDFQGLGEVAMNPTQVTSRNDNQAFRIMQACPDDLIDTKTIDGQTYRLGPSVPVDVKLANGEWRTFDVAVAVREGNKSVFGKSSKDIPFLVIDRNLQKPAVLITNEPSYSELTAQSGMDVSDAEIDLVLNKIEAHIEDIVRERKDSARRTRQRRWRTGRNTAAAAVVIAGVIGAGTWGTLKYNQDVANKQAAERAQQEASEKAHWDSIARFDGKGIILQSELVGPGNIGIASLDRFALSLLEEAPPFEDLLDNPRKLEIMAGGSKQIAVVPPGKGVRAVSNAPKGHVTIDVLEDGSIWLSALPDTNLGEGQISPSYNVLIQSQTLSPR